MQPLGSFLQKQLSSITASSVLGVRCGHLANYSGSIFCRR